MMIIALLIQSYIIMGLVVVVCCQWEEPLDDFWEPFAIVAIWPFLYLSAIFVAVVGWWRNRYASK